MFVDINDLKVSSIEDTEIPIIFQPLTKITTSLIEDQLNSDQINSIIDEICKNIDESLINIESIAHILTAISEIRPKNIKIYADLYKILYDKYNFEHEPESFDFKTLLNWLQLQN